MKSINLVRFFLMGAMWNWTESRVDTEPLAQYSVEMYALGLPRMPPLAVVVLYLWAVPTC